MKNLKSYVNRYTLFFSVFLFSSVVATDVLAQQSNDMPRRRFRFFDAENPSVHDPVMAYDNGRYYIYQTGMNIGVMSSADLKTWKEEPSVLKESPRWAMDSINGYRGHTWAPDIIRGNDGLWHIYYSCSTFGKNRSAIGEAVGKTLDPSSPDYGWEDRGMVIASHPGKDNFNAIDANVIFDKKGNPWMTFGSFWGGIQLFQLDKSMHKPVTDCKLIVSRREKGKPRRDNSVEGPFIIHRGNYYYMLVSFDYCCRGMDSNYKVAVGRSKNVAGPYKDKHGRRLDRGGGTIIYSSDPEFVAVGHCSAYSLNQLKAAATSTGTPGYADKDDDSWVFLAHGYSSKHGGNSKIFMRKMTFVDDWPVIEKTQ